MEVILHIVKISIEVTQFILGVCFVCLSQYIYCYRSKLLHRRQVKPITNQVLQPQKAANQQPHINIELTAVGTSQTLSVCLCLSIPACHLQSNLSFCCKHLTFAGTDNQVFLIIRNKEEHERKHKYCKYDLLH